MSVLQLLGINLDNVHDTVLRTIEFMDRAHHTPLTLADVAAAASLSPRRLQELFHIDDLQPPLAVLQRIRLLHTRQQLLDPDEQRSIRQIALAAQIPHAARFSSRYHAAFGELPSTTVARIRKHRQAPTPHQAGGYFDTQAMEYRRG